MAFPGKYYSVTRDGSSSIVVNFNSIHIYETYKEIILQNYQLVRVNKDDDETIEFEFRREEVHITLKNSSLYTTMKVDGNGRDAWWNEASHILDKQFKRLQSGNLQKPGADTDENKKPLVSEEDFRNFFAIPNVYGTYDLPWPRATILLYKYRSNATTKYWDIPEDTWKRIDNKYGQHAEKIMIEDLENIQDYLTIQPDDNKGSYKAILSVEVILSYSPCYKCALPLCKIKEKLDEKVKFKITFSNFYQHIEERNGIDNREGLKDLLRSGIKLDVFSDDNWHYFFNAAGLVTERQKREKADKKILQYLEGLVTSERILAIEQDLRENDLL